MIFKTWLSNINKAALTLESLNKINFNVNALSVSDISRIADVKDITTVFNELQSISKADYGDFGALKIQESAVAVSALSGELQASTLMMNGFSTTETQAVLSANGLTDAKIEQVLAFAQSGESIKSYNAEVIKACLQNSALSSTEQQSVLDKLGLIDATTGELISTKQVTQAKIEEALINSGLEASEASVTAERIVSTITQGTQKASIEAILALTKKQIVENTKYIASMVAAHPVATALCTALTALGGVILYNTHKEKEYQKILKESVNTMSNATSEYSNSASKLSELTKTYISLEKQLSLTNITEEETYQIKSDLYDIQCSLIDNFGNEAKGIDLVNGEYHEQLSLIQQINKEAADAFLTKNKEDYKNNISYLTDKKDFRSKYTSKWSSKNSGYMSDDLRNILEANGLTIDAETWRSELGGSFTKYFVEFENVTREEAYNLAMQLGKVLRSAGEENADLTQDPYYDLVQSYLSYVTTELIDESELNSAKENADYYEKLSAMSSSSFSELYNNFVDARDEYREALQTGENVDDARINFDNIYGEFLNSSQIKSDEIENAFADVKNSIDEELVKLNDWEKSLSGSNELDIISSLRVTDDQLRGINWNDEFTSPTEEAFGNLLTYLGASREDIEQVISLLVKMKSVIGEADVKNDTLNNNTPFPQAWTASFTSEDESVRKLGNTLLELAEQGRLTIETFNNADSSDYFKNLGISADEAVSKINRMADESQQLSSMANQISSMSEALDTKQAEGFVSADVLSGFDAEVRGLESWDKFQTFLGSVSTSYDECQEAASALASEWINNSDFLAQLTEENKEYYATQLEAMGIENYEEIISYAQSLNEAKEALAQANEMSGEATQDEIEALIAEGAYSELTAGLILQLYDAKIAEQALTLDTSADCEELIALAGDADKTSRSIQLLLQLKDIYNGFESGIYDDNHLLREKALADVDRIKGELEELANGESENSITIPGVTLGNKGKSAAKSAGRDAGDAYVDAFEKELDDLKTLRDRGTITEKAYLDEFRRLYQRYYRDKKKYAEEYAKYEHEYLQGMKSLYESALSGITSMLDKQIGTYEDQKSAAVDSLEAERDARIEVLETQKEQYEEQIKLIDEQIEAKEKIIDGINEEIDAIKDANEQRKREIDLEKSKYELERMMNQRTILQYSADKGMHYTQDTEGARDAKQAVEDAELEIEIAGKEEQIKLIEKEIDLLEERKESINEQIDLLDVQIDQINKQYDQMIAETEQYWDSIIQGMEDYKSRWQELGEIEEQAKLTATLEQLGISTNDILNMSGEAFARFKEEYFSLLADIYSGNDTMLSGLSDAAGMNTEALGSYLEATQQYIDGLNGLGEAISPVSDAIGAVTGALTGGSSSGDLGTDGADTGTDAGTGGLVGAMNSLKEATDEALGSGGDESASDGTGAIGKFGQLKGAVTDVTAAIGSDTSETSGESVSGEQTDGTSENGKGLIGSVGNLGQKTEEILGEPDGEGVTGRFGQLSEVIGQAKDYVHEMLEGLRDIDGETFECTIKINVDMNGELPGAISGTISSKIQAGVRNFSNSKPVRDDTPHISSGLSSQSAETTAAESEPEISAFSPESFRNGAEPLPTQKDGSLLRPIGPGERAYELHKAFEPLLEKADDSFEYLSGNAMITHTRLIEKMVRDITAANMITNNKNIQPNIRIGDIRITCPGVTSREVAAQVGSELNRLFSGFHLYTEQQSAIR